MGRHVAFGENPDPIKPLYVGYKVPFKGPFTLKVYSPINGYFQGPPFRVLIRVALS